MGRKAELEGEVEGLRKGLEKTTDDLVNTRAAASDNDVALRRERAESEAHIRGDHAAAVSAATTAHAQDMAGMKVGGCTS
jgi:hypothetical protein